MKFLGNIIWLIFGGFETAIGYFTGGIALTLTIIGIPWALQLFKLGILCLWPFGSQVIKSEQFNGCLTLLFNVIWLCFGGLWTWLCHVGFGLLLFITVVGIPWGKQHFKLAKLAFSPFGKEFVIEF